MLVESVLSRLAELGVFFQTRGDTALEILALRQQLAVLKRKRPRHQLDRLDRIFWIALRRCRPRWTEVLIIVKPEVVQDANGSASRRHTATRLERTSRPPWSSPVTSNSSPGTRAES